MLNNELPKMKLPLLILASGSPRRAEILDSVGWKFLRDVPDIDEAERPDEPADIYVQRLARTKAEVVAARHPGEIVLGADTTVVVDGRIIGKPIDIQDARRMIGLLAGRTHKVLTGVALVKNGNCQVGLQSTSVKFAAMTADEVDFLAEQGDPLDKAGAYAVQAQAALFIEGIEGDYWNVVGLPISLVYRLAARLAEN